MDAIEKEIREGIRRVISNLMDRVMDRVLETDPFIREEHYAKKPLYAALVPDEIFKGSHFERRFVTPFGNTWEKLSKVVASSFHGHCDTGRKISGTIRTERLRRIQEILNRLEHSGKGENKIKPDWAEELSYILDGEGERIPCDVICDIYIESSVTGKKYAFELKAPLPNSDQTKVSKEKMFKLLAMDAKPIDYAYYALPYNPYGEKKDYSWGFPMRWFDMCNDDSVLIGHEFWDLIGGNGTYEIFVEEVARLGVQYKSDIYKNYLGIEEKPQSFSI